ncbi:Interactor of constitutive active ROPs 1 [Heracleum sosnowskyi]|uniref:Interactor of constitutive active ROPs 1 n=1 Tax=Heracleum sosnowskyi TaxID=360622 RepID=A0AAD8GTS5_9APIA|nr:Interactor of constitutive active ROPs 1 [Heracleum sosnowskyi]
MSRLRASDVPQKSPKLVTDRKVLSHQAKASSLSSDGSPRLKDRRSPRGSQSDPVPVNQKKLGSRIAGLETQLEQAQEELKMLKDQLASAETAKKEAQKQLESKTTKSKTQEHDKKTTKLKREAQQKPQKKSGKVISPESDKVLKEYPHPCEIQVSKKTEHVHENVDNDQLETDVFEVEVEKATVEAKPEFSQPTEENELNSKFVCLTTESPVLEPENPRMNDLALRNEEIILLKANLELKEKELEVFSQSNENLKLKLNDATAEVLSGRAKEEEIALRLKQLAEELETSKGSVDKLTEKLGAAEGAKQTLETEMKKLKVQTEQWRKAADAAAAVLAGDNEMNGRRLSQRCGSMDTHYYEPAVGGYPGFVGSPGLGGNDSDDGFGNGKRKGSSIRMFGDLWKKKGQK